MGKKRDAVIASSDDANRLLKTLDEPTTVPGLRDPGMGQINLRLRGHGVYERDDLRAGRGILIGALVGFAIICTVWGFVLLLG